jgi:hypothetical protein
MLTVKLKDDYMGAVQVWQLKHRSTILCSYFIHDKFLYSSMNNQVLVNLVVVSKG